MVHSVVIGGNSYTQSKAKKLLTKKNGCSFYKISKVHLNECNKTKELPERHRHEWLASINRRGLQDNPDKHHGLLATSIRMKEMKNGDESLFYTIYRMSPATFDMLHSLVKEKLTKGQCPSREPISSGERLALTLRYLSSGMLVRDAAKAFCVGIETARNIIHETCTVLLEVLSPEYMKERVGP
ncbi:hypothetical protein MRX96_023613 [Rhipicephalus microplus]